MHAIEGERPVRPPSDRLETIMTQQTLRLLLCVPVVCAAVRVAGAQNLQVHYDWRHTVDPQNNPRNFPELTFKSFKALEFGSFLLKLEVNLDGSRKNASKAYTEVSQTLKFWTPPIFLHLEYTGGLGLFDGGTGGYYLDNAYLIGAAHPFQWQGSWANIYLAYKYTNSPKPSHDPQVSLYWGKGFGDHWDFASTAVCWTQNKNHGDPWTANLSGKRFAFLVENEVWYKPFANISVGSEIRVSYNVYATDGRLLIYPTIGTRYLF
jgi:hypothetical protein